MTSLTLRSSCTARPGSSARRVCAELAASACRSRLPAGAPSRARRDRGERSSVARRARRDARRSGQRSRARSPARSVVVNCARAARARSASRCSSRRSPPARTTSTSAASRRACTRCYERHDSTARRAGAGRAARARGSTARSAISRRRGPRSTCAARRRRRRRAHRARAAARRGSRRSTRSRQLRVRRSRAVARQPEARCSAALGTRALVWQRDRWERAARGDHRRVNAGSSTRRRARRGCVPGRRRVTIPRHVAARTCRRSCRRRAAQRRDRAAAARARAAARAEAASELLAPYTPPEDGVRAHAVRGGRAGHAAASRRRRSSCAARIIYRDERARSRRGSRAQLVAPRGRARPACARPASCSAPSRAARDRDAADLTIEPSFGERRQPRASAERRRGINDHDDVVPPGAPWQLEAEASAGRGVTARRYPARQWPRPDRRARSPRTDRRAADLVPRRLAPRAPGRDRHGAPVRAPDVRPDREPAARRVRSARRAHRRRVQRRDVGRLDVLPAVACPRATSRSACGSRPSACSTSCSRPTPVETERDVVTNERRERVEDDVDGWLDEQLMAHAFTEHPYRWPTIGWMEDIRALVAARHPRVLPDLVRAEQRDDRRASVTSTSRAARADRDALRRDPAGAAARGPARSPSPSRRASAIVRAPKPIATDRLLVGYKAPGPGRGRLGRPRDRGDAARGLPVGAAASPARDRGRARRRRSMRS